MESPAVVVVADRGPHAVGLQRDAGTIGDIGETQRPLTACAYGEIVAEQPAPPCALWQKGVEVAVAVVVEERRTGAHDLVHVVLPLGAVDVGERNGRWSVLEKGRRLNPQGDQGDQGER